MHSSSSALAHTPPVSALAPTALPQKTALISLACLMATTSVGPGFLTQTTVFTSIYQMDMAFPILASIFLTFVIVMNLWRVVGVSGLRIQDIANKVTPGLGYGIGSLLALGAVAFNFGNISGSAMGIQVLTGIDTFWGTLITGALGCLLFVAHHAAKQMDRMARYLGMLMIVLIAYVALTTQAPIVPTLIAAVSPSDFSSLFLPTLTIVGGAVGGYYTGAQRMVDLGFKGKDAIQSIKQAAWMGIGIAVVIRVLLFLAVLGVIVKGVTLDMKNPAADAFLQGAGQLGYHIFGLVLFVAAITSVVGNSYMAISLIKTLVPAIARHERQYCLGFIVLTTLATLAVDLPLLLLMLAGLVNSLILPIVLSVILIASTRKDIIGDYQHPKYLTVMGMIVVALMAAGSLYSVSGFMQKFAG